MSQKTPLDRAIDQGEVRVNGVRLEVAWRGRRREPDGPQARVLVFLHEGLGCVAMWRDFPEQVSARVGLGALVYSRAGYGRSDGVTLPRPIDYMQREGTETLPALLEALDVDDAVLFGHSDGGSIALVCAGSPRGASRVRALVLEAPHVFCEQVSVDSIARAREAYATTNLREKLARHHGANVDCAFRGWNDAWLDPTFADWNIEAYAREVRVPTLVIQGEDDEYGTLRQVQAIEEAVRGPVDRCVLTGVGHSPHRDAPEAVLSRVEAFVARLPR